MIQAVTFWFPSWRPLLALERVTFSPSQKGHKELPGTDRYQFYKKQCWNMCDLDKCSKVKDSMGYGRWLSFFKRLHVTQVNVSWGLSQKKQVIRLVKLWFDGTDDIYIYVCFSKWHTGHTSNRLLLSNVHLGQLIQNGPEKESSWTWKMLWILDVQIYRWIVCSKFKSIVCAYVYTVYVIIYIYIWHMYFPNT